MRQFSVVSTFSGCGGSSLGYQQAGGKVLLAVEWDDHAAATYAANFPGTQLYHGDIAQLSVREALERTGLRPGELDVLDGSPPCQGFSTNGVRQLDDPRNQLFREYVRLLRGLRPKAFVMENVRGMVMGKMRGIFAEAMQELRASGYRVRAAVVHAWWYGVPQNRPRLIVLGAREDLGVEPSHPAPTVRRGVTCREALADVPHAPGETEHLLTRLSSMARRWWYIIHPGKSGNQLSGPGGACFSTIKLHPDRPAPTLCKVSTDTGYGTILHWAEPRSISIPEALRLQGFPDSFKLEGKFKQRWARIGNSVPPPMMRVIAAHVRKTVLR